MKPFSIKEHLEHPDWKVVTRDGRPARIVCTDLDDDDYPVAAVVANFHVDKYTAGGLFQAGEETKYDLFFASEKHEGWVNVMRNVLSNKGYLITVFGSEEEAKSHAKDSTLATVEIEWEDKQ